VALQRRDLRILETVLARRAETLEVLRELEFRGLSRKRALNRLGELAGAGYLQRVSLEVLGAEGPQSVYTLGPKGKRALELRSLASEAIRYRRFNPILRDSSIPHQIATNRIADWLGAQLLPEHLLPAPSAEAARHRPDGMYEVAQSDRSGRAMVLLEVDMGHYSRARILGKVAAFLEHRRALAVLFACPNEQRATLVERTIRERYDEYVLERITVRTFEQLRAGARPIAYDEPLDPAPRRESVWTEL
jgi:Replication-relaxation